MPPGRERETAYSGVSLREPPPCAALPRRDTLAESGRRREEQPRARIPVTRPNYETLSRRGRQGSSAGSASCQGDRPRRVRRSAKAGSPLEVNEGWLLSLAPTSP